MDKRYHVHVCFAANDLLQERSLIMQQLAKQCFFTWSLQDTGAVNNNYSRKQIDQCDYVLFLVGNKYGQLAASGVSFLHLDYIYATSKLKPMFALLLANPEKTLKEPENIAQKTDNVFNQRKLKDFRLNLIKSCENSVEFHDGDDFVSQLLSSFSNLTNAHPSLGWIKNTNKKPNDTSTEKPDHSGEFTALGIDKTELQDKLKFTYRVQAFKDGNFKEVFLPTELPWGSILSIIAESIRMPANEDSIAKALYDHLDSISLVEVQKIIPDAHAATRSQLNTKDMQNIKLQLIANDWITVTDYTANGKKLVILTPQGARQVTQWRSVIERKKIYST